MILYINNEHCSSVEQLKGYFTENLTPSSDTYADLLDYGRYGDIAEWLREMEELEMASRVDSISGDLGDSAFFSQLKAAILDTEITDTKSLKPAFEKCFKLESVKYEVKEKEARVTVNLKVLMCVHEEYELSLTSNWGTYSVKVSPYEYSEGQNAKCDFTLHRRSEKDFGIVNIKIDGVELKARIIIVGNGNIIFDVKGITFKMICVEGGIFMMGNDKEPYSNPLHKVTVNSFMCGETLVTQDLWKAVMGDNPSIKKGSDIPVHNVSWEDCQKFITRLNEITGNDFRLLTEAEWEYAARGGIHSKSYIYSGSNSCSEICRVFNNETYTFFARMSSDYEYVYPVKKYKANELGIHDMCGNVLEWCHDYFDYRYNPTPDINPQGPNKGEEHVLRGGYSESGIGSYRKTIMPNTNTWRSPYIDYDFKEAKGLRLACDITVKEGLDSLKPVNVYSVICKTDCYSLNKNQKYHAAQFLHVSFKNIHTYICDGYVLLTGVTRDKADAYVNDLADYGITAYIKSCVDDSVIKSKAICQETSVNEEGSNHIACREEPKFPVFAEHLRNAVRRCFDSNVYNKPTQTDESLQLGNSIDSFDHTTNVSPAVETKRKNNSFIGKVVNYYAQQKVAEVLLENAGVHVGDIIYIKGHTTEKFIVELKEVRTANGSPKSVKQGRIVTFKVSKPVRKKDKVYLKKGYDTLH